MTPPASTSSNIIERGANWKVGFMSEHKPTRPIARCPSHPGALLDDIIPATGKTKVEIANLLGISRQQLYDIIREKKPVSPAIAARLGKMFGDGAAVWLRMQAAYDAWHAERDVDVTNIPTLRAA
jgi:addiction module HigA family antidote